MDLHHSCAEIDPEFVCYSAWGEPSAWSKHLRTCEATFTQHSKWYRKNLVSVFQNAWRWDSRVVLVSCCHNQAILVANNSKLVFPRSLASGSAGTSASAADPKTTTAQPALHLTLAAGKGLLQATLSGWYFFQTLAICPTRKDPL